MESEQRESAWETIKIRIHSVQSICADNGEVINMTKYRIAPKSGAKGFYVNAKNKKAAAAKGAAKRRRLKGYGRGFTVETIHR